MADVTRATLGNTAYLFNEQYVVKAAEKGIKFAWHQDSGYIGHYHKPYLSCWCALDDMTIENGTIFVLSYEEAGMKADDLFDHVVEAGTNDKVGYHGSSWYTLFSSSGEYCRLFKPNASSQWREHNQQNAPQLSGPIFFGADHEEGWNGVWAQAVPLLVNGERVAPLYTK